MRFYKGHGTGNDFVILPDPDGQLALTPALVAALCDRRRGIGADGVLRVVRCESEERSEAESRSVSVGRLSAKHPEAAGHAAEAEWFMDYWNSDGSYAEMCGNGVRVFVRYLLAAGLVAPGAGGLPVATRAGVVRAVVGPQAISVDMGLPKVYADSAATVGGYTFPGVAVDCGNPHLVCALSAGVELSILDLTRPPIVDPQAFPAGVNVEFVVPGEPVEDADVHVRMRVYERGSAETLSCGSGACAVAAVALRDAGRDAGVVAVDVPGGRLTATFDGSTCWLSGPAVLVASGEVDPAAL